MIESLPLFHRIAGRPVIVVGGGEAAEAKRRLVERAGGVVAGEDERHANLAFVAVEDRAAAEATAIRLRCRGMLVNVADRPELCDFTLPSILDRAPVLIAVGTGGASAGLAKALRLRLEAWLPSSLGALAANLRQARQALRQRWPDADERRGALDAALKTGGPLDPLDEGSAARVEAWLSSSNAGHPQSQAEICLRSDDPDELTLRQARLLGTADRLFVEPGVASRILDRARADASRFAIAVGELPPESPGRTVVLRLRS